MHYFPAAVVNYYYEKISYMETDNIGIIKSEFSGQYSYSVNQSHNTFMALWQHWLGMNYYQLIMKLPFFSATQNTSDKIKRKLMDFTDCLLAQIVQTRLI